MTPSMVQDEQLAEWGRRIRNSDRDALAALFRALRADLLWYVRGRLSHPEAADDLVQETFLRLWNRRRTIDTSKSLRGYLFATARHLALNHDRQIRTRRSLLSAMPQRDAHSNLDEVVDADRLGEHMASWIAELPARQREAFELSRFAGLSLKEIARVMEISNKTVEKHIGHALEHLRDRLYEYDPDILRS